MYDFLDQDLQIFLPVDTVPLVDAVYISTLPTQAEHLAYLQIPIFLSFDPARPTVLPIRRIGLSPKARTRVSWSWVYV